MSEIFSGGFKKPGENAEEFGWRSASGRIYRSIRDRLRGEVEKPEEEERLAPAWQTLKENIQMECSTVTEGALFEAFVSRLQHLSDTSYLAFRENPIVGAYVSNLLREMLKRGLTREMMDSAQSLEHYFFTNICIELVTTPLPPAVREAVDWNGVPGDQLKEWETGIGENELTADALFIARAFHRGLVKYVRRRTDESERRLPSRLPKNKGRDLLEGEHLRRELRTRALEERFERTPSYREFFLGQTSNTVLQSLEKVIPPGMSIDAFYDSMLFWLELLQAYEGKLDTMRVGDLLGQLACQEREVYLRVPHALEFRQLEDGSYDPKAAALQDAFVLRRFGNLYQYQDMKNDRFDYDETEDFALNGRREIEYVCLRFVQAFGGTKSIEAAWYHLLPHIPLSAMVKTGEGCEQPLLERLERTVAAGQTLGVHAGMVEFMNKLYSAFKRVPLEMWDKPVTESISLKEAPDDMSFFEFIKSMAKSCVGKNPKKSKSIQEMLNRAGSHEERWEILNQRAKDFTPDAYNDFMRLVRRLAPIRKAHRDTLIVYLVDFLASLGHPLDVNYTVAWTNEEDWYDKAQEILEANGHQDSLQFLLGHPDLRNADGHVVTAYVCLAHLLRKRT